MCACVCRCASWYASDFLFLANGDCVVCDRRSSKPTLDVHTYGKCKIDRRCNAFLGFCFGFFRLLLHFSNCCCWCCLFFFSLLLSCFSPSHSMPSTIAAVSAVTITAPHCLPLCVCVCVFLHHFCDRSLLLFSINRFLFLAFVDLCFLFARFLCVRVVEFIVATAVLLMLWCRCLFIYFFFFAYPWRFLRFYMYVWYIRCLTVIVDVCTWVVACVHARCTRECKCKILYILLFVYLIIYDSLIYSVS